MFLESTNRKILLSWYFFAPILLVQAPFLFEPQIIMLN